MFEGGWDFDEEQQKAAPNDWSKGNALHSMVYAIGIYIIFTLTARSRLTPNLLLFSTLFIVYIINTQRRYLENRNKIKEKTKATTEAKTFFFERCAPRELGTPRWVGAPPCALLRRKLRRKPIRKLRIKLRRKLSRKL